MDDSASLEPLPAGTSLHEFVIREPLGRGGVGIVYAAEHAILRETFVIKEFLPRHLAYRADGRRVAARPGQESVYEQLRQKFLEEGQTLVQLARPRPHPNLVQVTDAFHENDTVYLCMRFERGEPLDAILEARGRIGEAELMRWILPLLDGLEHAHARQVWHRDIKPSNILIREDGTPLLIDFGAAHRERADSAVSVISQYTPSFAAPEQMFGGAQGPWTDIYAMAATGFYAVTGGPPPPRLSPDWQTQCCGYHPSFLMALEAGLQFDSQQRPQTVAQWRTLFKRVVEADVETRVVGIGEAETLRQVIAPPATSSGTAPQSAPDPAGPSESRLSRLRDQPDRSPPPGRWIYPLAGLAVLLLSLPLGFLARDWIGAPDRVDPPLPLDSTPVPPEVSVPDSRQTHQPAGGGESSEAGPLDAAQLAERLGLAGLDCARVKLESMRDTDLRLSGYLRDRAQLTKLIERLNELAPDAAVDDRDIAFAAPFCDILARMSAVGADGAGHPGMPAILFSHPDRLYHEEDYLVLTVANAGAVGGYLYLDFIDSNQDVVHLFPTAAMPDHFVAPGAQIVIGARDDAQCEQEPDACFVVSRPHGNNLILATWSETPLFARRRIDQSEPAGAYLTALTAALDNGLSGRPVRHAVAYHFFTTMH
ncbi:serine/threonine protein kinase [Thiobaca trueperi]|uniref:Serine/threonine protein kinase n=1 Tax=Thiobaca trueperi TaxID=127458 RepID=A0A4R3MS23_9GAMM|nr:serine/threonine protein kinase [Thiobaca trueperi]TCT18122.1 serine/threonine protein kinase [Thiobaca trueperi]